MTKCKCGREFEDWDDYKYHFFHIAGLQYLWDLPRLAVSAEEVYNQLESGHLPISYIESSKNRPKTLNKYLAIIIKYNECIEFAIY